MSRISTLLPVIISFIVNVRSYLYFPNYFIRFSYACKYYGWFCCRKFSVKFDNDVYFEHFWPRIFVSQIGQLSILGHVHRNEGSITINIINRMNDHILQQLVYRSNRGISSRRDLLNFAFNLLYIYLVIIIDEKFSNWSTFLQKNGKSCISFITIFLINSNIMINDIELSKIMILMTK